MTSPVDTSIKYITSQMAGAPVLSGTAGALNVLLEAFLVTGFDIKTLASLSVAGGIATASYTGAHSAMVDSVVLISGVTGGPAGFAGLNGEQKITGKASAGNSVTFATALPDGVYTGTITMKMAPLGWAKRFSKPGVSVFQSADVTSSGCLLRVDDSGTTVARVVGYESMSDVDTGVGPFPASAQMAGGGIWTKSTSANATPTQWVLAGDSKFFMFINVPGIASSAGYQACVVRGFGDPITLKPGGDPFGCVLNCSVVAPNSPSSQWDGGFDRPANATTTFSPRTHTGLGSSVAQWAAPLMGSGSKASGQDATLGVFPNEQVDGALRLSRRFVQQVATRGIRAFVPGVMHIPQNALAATFGNFDRFTAVDGRRYICMLTNEGSFDSAVTTASGIVPIDITGPWR